MIEDDHALQVLIVWAKVNKYNHLVRMLEGKETIHDYLIQARRGSLDNIGICEEVITRERARAKPNSFIIKEYQNRLRDFKEQLGIIDNEIEGLRL